MTVRDFFRLMLKLFGLYYLIINLFAFPTHFAYLFYDFTLLQVVGVVMLSLALVSLYLYILFNPDRVINLFKLDRGFESDTIDLHQVDKLSVLKIGVLVIGGLFFLHNVGSLLVNLYMIFKSSVGSDVYEDILMSTEPATKADVAIDVLNLVVSWLLVTNSDLISRFLMQKRPDANPDTDATN